MYLLINKKIIKVPISCHRSYFKSNRYYFNIHYSTDINYRYNLTRPPRSQLQVAKYDTVLSSPSSCHDVASRIPQPQLLPLVESSRPIGLHLQLLLPANQQPTHLCYYKNLLLIFSGNISNIYYRQISHRNCHSKIFLSVHASIRNPVLFSCNFIPLY